MKRFYLILILLSFSVCGFAREYKVYGSQGGLAMEVTLPDEFNEATDNDMSGLWKSLRDESLRCTCNDFIGKLLQVP